MNGASKSNKRKVLDFKQKQKIIQEYDELVKRQGNVNKTKFAEKYGLAKSSLSTILDSKNRQVMEVAELEGKAIEGRKRLKTSLKLVFKKSLQTCFSNLYTLKHV